MQLAATYEIKLWALIAVCGMIIDIEKQYITKKLLLM